MFKLTYKPKNLIESLLPILVFNWIFGHQLLQYPIKDFEFFQTFFYSILIVTFFYSALGYTMWYCYKLPWFSYQENIFFITVIVNILILCVNFVLGWIFKNRSRIISMRCLRVDEKLRDLGMTINNQQAYNYSAKLTIFWIMSVFILNFISTLWSHDRWHYLQNLAVVSTVQHAIHANSLVDLSFCSLIRHMELRFKNINSALLKFQIIPFEVLSMSTNQFNQNEKIVGNRAILSRNTLKNFNYVLPILKNSHLELTSLCGEITQIFGLQLIMTISSSFILITTMLYNLYLLILNTEFTNTDKIYRVMIFVSWVINNGLKIIFINHTCSKTISQAGKIIHECEIKSQDADFCRQIQQFSIQILQNPLYFSPCGLISLGYTLMRDLSGSITTYLVILIQMSNSDQH
ncbi:putative gustatory receptor 28b isoform X2 [Microplitis mediator]|uniref:putative gustatory receptor 28b isoform X2 n=1 Tax=Microplitis mediator TaxID=375433 RepID=UPI002553E075|nr:putative gustatory receptor 28b isoform X2 [Microplitis mediator]